MAEMLLTIEQVAERLQLHPESALTQPQVADAQTPAEAIWRDLTSDQKGRHNAAIRDLAQSPAEVRAIVMERSAQAAAAYYATPEGEAELADWRALDGEPFHDDAGDYYSAEEEAGFRARKLTDERAN